MHINAIADKKMWLGVAIIGVSFFLMQPVAAAIDSDSDFLTDDFELIYHTDPHNGDTDGDGYLDGIEVMQGYSPHKGDGTHMNKYDYDGDGLNDWLERWFHSDIGNPDTDGDGMSDYDEVMRGYSPSGEAEKQFDRKIEVDLTQQRLYFYTDGVKISNFPVSTGNPQTPTPPGEYTMMRKIGVKTYVGADYYLTGVKWNVEFLPSYYIHTAYWHNDFGKRTRSHGCVNMREADAKIIYDVIDDTVPISIIGNTPVHYFVAT